MGTFFLSKNLSPENFNVLPFDSVTSYIQPKTKKVARKLMPRPGSKRIARSRRGGLLAGEFRRTLGSTRNPRHTNLGSESQLA